MADSPRNKMNTFYQKQNQFALKKTELNKHNFLDAAVQRGLGFTPPKLISDLAATYSLFIPVGSDSLLTSGGATFQSKDA
tara:strand:- start:1510 stop:1749 length:240 start_codon:yes stop_codon:yes gene_type:complete